MHWVSFLPPSALPMMQSALRVVKERAFFVASLNSDLARSRGSELSCSGPHTGSSLSQENPTLDVVTEGSNVKSCVTSNSWHRSIDPCQDQLFRYLAWPFSVASIRGVYPRALFHVATTVKESFYNKRITFVAGTI